MLACLTDSLALLCFSCSVLLYEGMRETSKTGFSTSYRWSHDLLSGWVIAVSVPPLVGPGARYTLYLLMVIGLADSDTM